LSFAVIVLTVLVLSRVYLAELLRIAQHLVSGYQGLDRFQDSFYRWLFYFSPYLRMFEFFMGCLAAHVFILYLNREVTSKERRLADMGLAIALITLAAFGAIYIDLIGYGQLRAYVQHLSLNFLCAPAIAFVLFYVGRYDSGFTRVLSSPTLVALGDTSYSIYLIHTWTLRIFIKPAAPEVNWFWGCEAAFRVAAAIVLTLLASYATYHLIEVPSRTWLRGRLTQLISWAYQDGVAVAQTREPPKHVEALPQTAAIPSVDAVRMRARFLFSANAASLLALVFLVGQALRSDYVDRVILQVLAAGRPVIAVDTASYGWNCRNYPVPPPHPKATYPGNVTAPLRGACDGRVQCTFLVNAAVIGDPANGCEKELSVQYRCSDSDVPRSTVLPAEAHGKTAILACTDASSAK
jgi:hypothetical protein